MDVGQQLVVVELDEVGSVEDADRDRGLKQRHRDEE
jgi:hypothetical protein